MNNPLVSIIIPTYNYDKYIVDCLVSCCNQSYGNVEIVVVDDYSTDRSYEMACRVRDNRITVLKHYKNWGYSAAKNTAILRSKGKYVTTLDADDCLTTNSITDRVRYLEEHPDVGVVHGLSYKFDGAKGYGCLLRKEHRLEVDKRPDIHAQAVMVRRDVYEKHGLYYEKMRSKADKEMWKRLEMAGVKFAKIPSKCAFYRCHARSMQRYRDRNQGYNEKVEKQFKERIKQLKAEGITRENTRFM